MPVTPFALASALSPTTPGHFEAHIDAEWTIGGKPNGGYLLAMLARAAVAVVPHDDVIIASAHYLHSPAAGPVTIEAEVLRVGRSASQARVRMSQAGTACVEALLTVSTLESTPAPFWDGGLPLAPVAAWDDCVRIPARSPSGAEVSIMNQVDLRIDPATLAWAGGQPSGAGELRGWLALSGGVDFDPIALLFAVDAFPPATFDIQLTGWVPTLELTAYIRARPAPGPVRVLQRAQMVDGQKVDEVCLVWDQTGRLVAQCTQLAAIRLG